MANIYSIIKCVFLLFTVLLQVLSRHESSSGGLLRYGGGGGGGVFHCRGRPVPLPSPSHPGGLSSYLDRLLPVSVQEEAFHRVTILLRKESVCCDMFPFFFCLLWRREFRTVDLPPITDQVHINKQHSLVYIYLGI